MKSFKITAEPVALDKLNKIQQYCDELINLINEQPGKTAISAVVVAGGGALMALSGPILIGIGVATCALGKSVVGLAFWIAGIGTVIGCSGHSAKIVKHSLYAAGIIAGVGAGLYLTGSILKVGGYLMIAGGMVITVGGLAVAGSALHKLRNSQKAGKQNEIARAIIMAIHKLKTNNKDYDNKAPVFVINLKEETK